MTKTEYREYIAGPVWRERKRLFIATHDACNRCEMPRWAAVLAYDQDLHVHHASYARIGREIDADLETLCRRCHEVETFGSSALHKPKVPTCSACGYPAFGPAISHSDTTPYCIDCSRVHFYLETCRQQERVN